MIFKMLKNLFKKKSIEDNNLNAMFVKDYFMPIDFKNFDRKVKITKIFKLDNINSSTPIAYNKSYTLCHNHYHNNPIKKTFIIPVGKPKRKNIFKNFIKGLMMK